MIDTIIIQLIFFLVPAAMIALAGWFGWVSAQDYRRKKIGRFKESSAEFYSRKL